MTARLFAIIVILAIGAGCSSPASARFDVGDVQKHQDCMSEAFPFVPVFHAARERDESLGIFFQSRGGNFQFVDAVHFEVFDPESTPTGEPIDLDPVVFNDSKVASDLVLGMSCPELTDSIGMLGTITFDDFSTEIDGLIRGRVDASLVSLRSGDVIAGSFTGNFDFLLQVGQPFEEFRN